MTKNLKKAKGLNLCDRYKLQNKNVSEIRANYNRIQRVYMTENSETEFFCTETNWDIKKIKIRSNLHEPKNERKNDVSIIKEFNNADIKGEPYTLSEVGSPYDGYISNILDNKNSRNYFIVYQDGKIFGVDKRSGRSKHVVDFSSSIEQDLRSVVKLSKDGTSIFIASNKLMKINVGNIGFNSRFGVKEVVYETELDALGDDKDSMESNFYANCTRCLSESRDGKYLYVGSNKGTVRKIEAKTGEILSNIYVDGFVSSEVDKNKEFEIYKSSRIPGIKSIDFSPTNNSVAILYANGMVLELDVKTGKCINKIDMLYNDYSRSPTKKEDVYNQKNTIGRDAISGEVRGIKYSKDGSILHGIREGSKILSYASKESDSILGIEKDLEEIKFEKGAMPIVYRTFIDRYSDNPDVVANNVEYENIAYNTHKRYLSHRSVDYSYESELINIDRLKDGRMIVIGNGGNIQIFDYDVISRANGKIMALKPDEITLEKEDTKDISDKKRKKEVPGFDI